MDDVCPPVHDCDIFFKVVDIKNDGKDNIVTLKGISYRIEADAPESDLVIQPESRVREYTSRAFMEAEKKTRNIAGSRNATKHRSLTKKVRFRNTSNDGSREFERPGKVLHLDGDADYLNACLDEYRKLGINAVGKHVPEKDQPSSVLALLKEYRPDILVLTGHDGVIKGEDSFLNLANYRNSKYFIDAVKEARKYSADLDGLVIFAGACQSMYNRIIKAGANFASAPYRVLIHALDPVLVCQKIAYSAISSIIAPMDVINATITGIKGIGGLQTRGKYRNGVPEEPYNG
jgi:spore coat assembly protein